MAFFFRRKTDAPSNEVDVQAGWPVRLSDVSLQQDLLISGKSHPEIYLVTEGTVLHTSPTGRQSLRSGSVVVAHAGQEHGFTEPDSAKLVCLGFLPEWLAGEFDVIRRCPDLFSLIFVHCWLDFPADQKVFVFTLPENRIRSVGSDLTVIRSEAEASRYLDPLLEVTFIKILLQLAQEYGNYWRQNNRIDFRDEIHHALRAVENVIDRGETLRLKTLEPAIGMSIDHFGRTFKKATGSTLVDYAQRRRAHHAAYLLLTEPEMKATAVARRLGFTDSAHLSKSFQKFFGHTPNTYRETFGNGAGKHTVITPIIKDSENKSSPKAAEAEMNNGKMKTRDKATPPPVPDDA